MNETVVGKVLVSKNSERVFEYLTDFRNHIMTSSSDFMRSLLLLKSSERWQDDRITGELRTGSTWKKVAFVWDDYRQPREINYVCDDKSVPFKATYILEAQGRMTQVTLAVHVPAEFGFISGLFEKGAFQKSLERGCQKMLENLKENIDGYKASSLYVSNQTGKFQAVK